ncbi:Os02g0244850, partial [Oryza sativa Japonica Group]
MRGEHEVNGLVLERIEHLLPRLAELGDEALERLLDVGLGGRGGLVGEVPALELDPAAVRDLHLLGEVGEVEHVREGAGDDDGVPRRQAGELPPQLVEPRLVPVVLVLRRQLQVSYEFAEVRAVQVLEDVEEAVDEEGVVLDELVVLGYLPRREQPQLRVDRLVPLHRRLPGGRGHLPLSRLQ